MGIRGGCARFSSLVVRCKDRLDINGYDETGNINQIKWMGGSREVNEIKEL